MWPTENPKTQPRQIVSPPKKIRSNGRNKAQIQPWPNLAVKQGRDRARAWTWLGPTLSEPAYAATTAVLPETAAPNHGHSLNQQHHSHRAGDVTPQST
jgi:hypothetical protein